MAGFIELSIDIIVIDVANEHIEIAKKISAISASTRRFRKGIFRIVPSQDPRFRQLELSRLFEHLLILASKAKMHNFAVLIDEGNELVDIKELKDFLIESRKYLRKVVIVSADPTPYEKICKPMRALEKRNLGRVDSAPQKSGSNGNEDCKQVI